MPADPVVPPADTIRQFIRYHARPGNADHFPVEVALDALLAVGERDKAEIEGLIAEVQRLADRAVCSGCGSDVGESGICPYPDCDDGEMIPASDLPVALRNRCDSIQEDRAEWRSDWEALRTEVKALEVAGERDRQHIAQLTETLRTAEWGGARYIGFENCPLCGNERVEGHGPNCSLAAVLADKEDAHGN